MKVGFRRTKPELITILLPLLLEHRVDAYICGHDHNMQFFHHDRLAHFHSGMGVKFNPSVENQENPLIPTGASKFWTIFSKEGKKPTKFLHLTPTLSAWLLRSHWTFKSIFQETPFLDQLHNFSFLSLNSFLQPFFKEKTM